MLPVSVRTMLRVQLFLQVWLCCLTGGYAKSNITVARSTPSSNSSLTCEEICAIRENQSALNFTVSSVKGKIVIESQHPDPILSLRTSVDEWPSSGHHRSPVKNDFLQRSSILFGLTQLANEYQVTRQCSHELKELANAILRRDVWAMKVFDSSGAKESGFLWGHNYWLGSRHGCEAVQNPVYITLSDQFHRSMKKGLINGLAPFEMDYRVLYVRHNSPWQVEIKFMSERIIHIGLCLPRSCSNNDVYNLTQTYLDAGQLDEGNIYDLHSEVMYIKDLKLKDNFFDRRSVRIFGVVLIFTVLMMIAAFVYDEIKAEREGVFLKDPLRTEEPERFIYKFIKCFSVVENIKSLFTVEVGSRNAFPIINGLRSVSCLCILTFHVIWYMYFTVDNKTFLISYGERVFFQYVSTAPLLVDVFFTISGFLLAYNFIKNQSNMEKIRKGNFWENSKTFMKLFLHRYLRLAPLYLVLSALVEVGTAYMEDVSIFHIHERNDLTCSKYWWRNMLFIQNLFHQDELCLNWTWSLACEMQFFILCTLFLFLYAKYPEQTKKVFLVTLVTSIVWSYHVCFRSRYRLSFDVIYHTGTQIYINPFVRIMPYLIGLGAGWFLASSNGKFETRPIVDKCLWNVAVLIFFACIYSTFKRDISALLSISLIVLGRASFSAAVSWMIIASATGREIFWSKFLEWNVFQHINKLSYAIYLLNPFVISMVFSSANSSTHADPIMLYVLTSGFFVVVYICSIIFSLSFEMPYCRLSSHILRRKVKKV